MGQKSIFGGLTLSVVAIAALPGAAGADTLTRSTCWTSSLDSGARRTMCFVGSDRVKMTNRNQTSDYKGWSTCEWSGNYAQTDDKVTVAFAPGSGKCSNGTAAPQWSVTCDFSGKDLDCRGAAIVDRKLYEVQLLFK